MKVSSCCKQGTRVLIPPLGVESGLSEAQDFPNQSHQVVENTGECPKTDRTIPISITPVFPTFLLADLLWHSGQHLTHQ
jgi:hypothetical protein